MATGAYNLKLDLDEAVTVRDALCDKRDQLSRQILEIQHENPDLGWQARRDLENLAEERDRALKILQEL